mgnify:CR=1 FL=1
MPYITPNSIPTTVYCGRLLIPDDIYILAAVKGAIFELTKSENWEQVGAKTPDEMATEMSKMYDILMEGSHCMIGSLIHYATSLPPTGVLACDGAVYNRVDYPILYDAILPILQIDADTFNVPNIQDAFMLASGANHDVFTNGGDETVTLSIDQLPSHSHSYNVPTTNIDVESVGVPDPTGAGIPMLPAVTGNTGNNQAHENMPPFVTFAVGIVAK